MPKDEVAIMAATSHVAAEDDGLVVQIKTWFSMESYATQVNISARARESKKFLEKLEKTTKLVEVGLPWAEENAVLQNN